MSKRKAAFIVGFLDEKGENIASTTRLDKPNSIGLPGGKVEPGETPYEAAIREAYEEGWDFTDCDILKDPIHIENIDQFEVYWFVCLTGKPKKLNNYKEKHRNIIPQESKRYVLVDYGNDKAIPKALQVFWDYKSESISESFLWDKHLLKKQLYSQKGKTNILITPQNFTDYITETAYYTTDYISKLSQRYDIAFITAFRNFENLCPLPEEEPLRKPIQKLTGIELEYLTNFVREHHPNFDCLPYQEQVILLQLEQQKLKKEFALKRNRERNEQLKQEIEKNPHYAYLLIRGSYQEIVQNIPTLVEEETFMIIDTYGTGNLKNDVIKLGKLFNQDAVVFIPKQQQPEFIKLSFDEQQPYKFINKPEEIQNIPFIEHCLIILQNIKKYKKKILLELHSPELLKKIAYYQIGDITQNKCKISLIHKITKQKVLQLFLKSR